MSSTTYKICPKCGAQMKVRQDVMTSSMPPMHIYDCPNCGEVEYDAILYPCDLGELATQSKNEVDLCDKTDRYEEALEKARVIYKGRKAMHYTDEVSDLEFLFPELAETYDEMMIEAIIDALNSHCNSINHLSARGYQMEDVKAWLEKRKINTEGDFGSGYDCGYQAGYAVAMNEMKPKVATTTLDSEKQQEQKPEYASASTIMIPSCWEEKQGEDEDERIREWLIKECQKVIDIANPAYDTSKAKKAIAWLEKQKEQKPCLTCDEYDKGYKQGYTEGCTAGYNKAILEQPKQEWSEGDKRCLQELMQYIEQCVRVYGESEPAWQRWMNLLNSLRNRYMWRPSEEQMNSLNYGIYVLEEEGYDASASEIKELYTELKKLKEE